MTQLLTAEQMRRVEQAAIASGQVTGLELMERAGQGVVDAIFEQWPKFAPAAGVDWGGSPPNPPGYFGPEEGGTWRVVVLCGPGNNGGDGFVVARLLAGLGWSVDVVFYGDVGRLPDNARVNYERWCQVGVVQALTDEAIDGFGEDNRDVVLAIDALFGTGLSRPFVDLGRVQDELNYWQASAEMPHVVSIDIPSGLCANSGRYLGFDQENPMDMCIVANLTVTFHCAKLGHHLGYGPASCGILKCVDIGLPQAEVAETVKTVPYNAPGCVSPLKRLAKASGHKFRHGSVLVVSGGAGRTGAARLAARGALRVGAGLVTLGVPPSAQLEVAGHITAIMLRRVGDTEALAEILQDNRLNALCLGPGLGLEQALALVPVALRAAHKPHVCLDADALSAFAGASEDLFALLHKRCVLTPHGGEFALLFPDIAEKLSAPAEIGPAYSKVDATREAAARAGCVVLFKGADTVIADAFGHCAVHTASYDRAAPWLATAGAGDVLAGFITGLMARGMGPMLAAETAAWLHVECARSFGPGLIAEDLPEVLPKVFREMGL